MTTYSIPGVDCTAPDPYPVRLACVRDFAFFEKFVMAQTAVDSRYGFHRDLCNRVARPRRQRKTVEMFLAPRGFLKSTIGNLDHSIWSLLVDREERILWVCGTEAKTISYFLEVTQKITDGETSAKLRWMAPDVFGTMPSKDLKIEKDRLFVLRKPGEKVPSILCLGERSGTSGFHHSLYKFDDLVNDENYQTELARSSAIQKFRDVMGTRRGYKSRVDIFDTIYHPQDLTQWIQDPKNGIVGMLDVWSRSCWYDGPKPDGSGAYAPGEESWWPEERPVEYLMEQKALLGPSSFAQQYLMVPSAEGARLFDPQWVRQYDQRWSDIENPGGESKLILPGDGDDEVEPRAWRNVMAIDAVSKGERATDRACLLAGAWNDLGELYLCDVYYDRPAPSDFFEMIYAWWLKWNPDVMFMENVGAMAYVNEDLLRDMKARGVSYPLMAPKRYGGSRGGGKLGRIEAIEPFAADGKLYVPRDRKWAAPLSEIEGYRIGQKDQRDDFLDALSDIVRHPRVPLSHERVRSVERLMHSTTDAATLRLKGVIKYGGRTGVRESARGGHRVYNPYQRPEW